MICQWEKWVDLKEDRIIPINKDIFYSMNDRYTHTNTNFFLYKKIHNPTFNIGVFFKSKKSVSEYLKKEEIQQFPTELWRSFPIRDESLVCYNYLEDVDDHIGETYLVFPFKNSLFTIAPEREFNYDPEVSKYTKGYWSDKIMWLDNLNDRELWTDSPCIIIKKSLWDSMNHIK